MYVLDVVEENFGRHETDAEFVKAVMNSINALPDHNEKNYQGHLVAGISELDEDDTPPEHRMFERQINRNNHRIGWHTFEPLVIGYDLAIKRSDVAFGCDGVPHLTPTRHLPNGLIYDPAQPDVKPVGVINHHAPRNTPKLAKEIAACKDAHKNVQLWYRRRGISYITMGDWNDPHYSLFFKDMETAVHNGLDYIRFWNAPEGAGLDVKSTSTFTIGIDPHKGALARIQVS
jgi:hypothetical protein